jgi:hypothetical protein
MKLQAVVWTACAALALSTVATASAVETGRWAAKSAKATEGSRKAAPAKAATAAKPGKPNGAVKAVAGRIGEPQATASVTPPLAGDPSCASARKRLWVESEGWVVRRVTTCY